MGLYDITNRPGYIASPTTIQLIHLYSVPSFMYYLIIVYIFFHLYGAMNTFRNKWSVRRFDAVLELKLKKLQDRRTS